MFTFTFSQSIFEFVEIAQNLRIGKIQPIDFKVEVHMTKSQLTSIIVAMFAPISNDVSRNSAMPKPTVQVPSMP